MLKSVLLVGIGGMSGVVFRYIFSIILKPEGFPYATLAVNIIGCLVIGLIMGDALKFGGLNNNWRLFLATGVCGGFTTFSAFSLECIQMLQQQRYSAMTLYISLSVVLGLGATFAGLQLSKL